MDGIVSGCQYP